MVTPFFDGTSGSQINMLSLVISGPTATGVTLFVQGPGEPSGDMTLFTQGPAAIAAPLWIGKDVYASGEMPLYLETPSSTGDPSSTLFQGDLTLAFASGTLFSGIPPDMPVDVDDPTSTDHPTAIPLYISVPSTGSGNATLPIHLATDAIPSGFSPGVIPHSEFVTIAVSGANPSGIGIAASNETTLFIRIQEEANSGVPLYIERNTAQLAPLFIKSQSPSGIAPLAVSGAFQSSVSGTLYIQAPTAKSLNLYTGGYSE